MSDADLIAKEKKKLTALLILGMTKVRHRCPFTSAPNLCRNAGGGMGELERGESWAHVTKCFGKTIAEQTSVLQTLDYCKNDNAVLAKGLFQLPWDLEDT